MCAVYAYAKYKNITDRKNKYIAARCGGMSNQTRFIFNKLNIPIPPLYKDIYPYLHLLLPKRAFEQ